MQPIYAVGDIHGQSAMLEEALTLIAADGGSDARIVFLGDYVDRGPDSAGVIDILITGRASGSAWTFVKGNHDRMFELFMQPTPGQDPLLRLDFSWLHRRIGGMETLASYGIDASGRFSAAEMHEMARDTVPPQHLAFLSSLDLSHQTDALFFAHAGIRPGVPLDEQEEDDLLWIRDRFLEHDGRFPKLVVHGHTAVDYPAHYGNRVNLDGGAGYGRPLVPAVFEGKDSWLLTRKGRVPLTT